MEDWRDVIGYEGEYLISNFGNVKSLNFRNTGEIRDMGIYDDRQGYKVTILHKNGVPHNHKVHRLVATAFIPNPNKLPIINHRDEDKANNYVDNLEWCTVKYNNNYNGSMVERNKLKRRATLQYDLENNFIREFESLTQIKDEFGFDRSAISRCCRGIQQTSYGFIWRYKEDLIDENN